MHNGKYAQKKAPDGPFFWQAKLGKTLAKGRKLLYY